jgi:hypothetical protein
VLNAKGAFFYFTITTQSPTAKAGCNISPMTYAFFYVHFFVPTVNFIKCEERTMYVPAYILSPFLPKRVDTAHMHMYIYV